MYFFILYSREVYFTLEKIVVQKSFLPALPISLLLQHAMPDCKKVQNVTCWKINLITSLFYIHPVLSCLVKMRNSMNQFLIISHIFCLFSNICDTCQNKSQDWIYSVIKWRQHTCRSIPNTNAHMFIHRRFLALGFYTWMRLCLPTAVNNWVAAVLVESLVECWNNKRKSKLSSQQNSTLTIICSSLYQLAGREREKTKRIIIVWVWTVKVNLFKVKHNAVHS